MLGEADDRQFQRRSWSMQRAGWVALAAWLLASATGWIAPGPGSRSRVTSADQRTTVQYERVLHLAAPTRIVVLVEREEAGKLDLALGDAYREAFHVRDVVPGPRTQAAGPDERRFTLEIDGAGRTRVEVELLPLAWGWHTGELRVDGRHVATLRHLVLP
jgi:hypothetical protein